MNDLTLEKRFNNIVSIANKCGFKVKQDKISLMIDITGNKIHMKIRYGEQSIYIITGLITDWYIEELYKDKTLDRTMDNEKLKSDVFNLILFIANNIEINEPLLIVDIQVPRQICNAI